MDVPGTENLRDVKPWRGGQCGRRQGTVTLRLWKWSANSCHRAELAKGSKGCGPEAGPVPRDAGVGQGGARENSGWFSRLLEERGRYAGWECDLPPGHQGVS